MNRLAIYFLFCFRFLIAVDYDSVFVGTSPIPLFEAIYQHYLGKRVLILEQAEECGGAWKAIDVCGIPHADLGCHQIGANSSLKDFLESCGGCKIVPMDHPDNPSHSASKNGFYFSKGCYELIRNLTKWIDAAGIDLLLGTRLESVYVDVEKKHLVVKTGKNQYTAGKIFYSSMSSFLIENNSRSLPYPSKAKYPHLYLLIQDATPPQFSYMNYGEFGASRAMNLSPFVGLAGTGRHLIVFQVNSEEIFNNGEQFLDDLKKRNLLGPSAYILREEPYTYELDRISLGRISPEWQPYFEMLSTGSFAGMISYVKKWKEVLPRYSDILPN